MPQRIQLSGHHWFVKSVTLTHPEHGDITLISRFNRLLCAHKDGRCLTPAEFAFYSRSVGVDLEAS